MNFCPNCGKPIQTPSKFCSECGYKLEIPQQPAPAYTPPVQQPPVYAPPVQQAPVYTPPVQQPPVYAPPVQQAPVYTPPVQEKPVYTPPVQDKPVYTPPVQDKPVYTPPVQEKPVYTPPVQEKPVYTPPVQEKPVYTPPVQEKPVYAPPVQDKPVYTPPVQEKPVYTPPVQEKPVYTPPVQDKPAAPEAPVYAPPAAPKAKKPASGKKNNNLLLFILIGVAVLAIVGIVLLFVLGGGSGDSPIGMYKGVSMMGIPLSGDDTWIELKEDGKGTFCMMDDRVPIQWSQDGDTVSLTVENDTVTGTLKDGKLELSFEGISLVFQKTESSAAPETTAPVVASEAGYWTLLRLENEDPEYALDESVVKTMRDLGAEVFLNLESDGSGTASLGFDSRIQWKDGKITLTDSYMEGTYTIVDGQLQFVLKGDDSTYIFVRGTGNPPQVNIGGTEETSPATTPPPVATLPPTEAVTTDYSWWEGDWYGWWVLVDTYGGYADYAGNCWDVCAIIDVTDSTGSITVWDPDYSFDTPLTFAELEFDEGYGSMGSFVSIDGYFMDADVGYYDWYCDPYTCEVSHFDHMFTYTGEYVDPEDPESGFTYMIVLRPWGMKWEDVRNGDTSGCTYADMMPPSYDDWYLPLLKSGIDYMPKTFAEGEDILSKVYGNY